MSSETHCEVLVARSHCDGRLYVVKTIRRNIASEPNLLNQIRAEQACLRAVTENDGPFLPVLHRSFYDDERLYFRIIIPEERFTTFLFVDNHTPYPLLTTPCRSKHCHSCIPSRLSIEMSISKTCWLTTRDMSFLDTFLPQSCSCPRILHRARPCLSAVPLTTRPRRWC